MFVDRAQGKTPVFRTEKRRHADGDLSVDCENDRCCESLTLWSDMSSPCGDHAKGCTVDLDHPG